MIAIDQQLRFSFVFAYLAEAFADTLFALGDGAIDADTFLTGSTRLADAPEAFERLGTPGADVKGIVQPWR